MLAFMRKSGQNFHIGVKDQTSPFTTNVDTIGNNSVKLGLQSYEPHGNESKLLSISRDDAKSEPNLDKLLTFEKADESMLKKYFDKKVFFRNRGIRNITDLKSTVNRLQGTYPDKTSKIIEFISLIKNGAFFKAWADHYTEQAKALANSLGLAA